MRVICNCGKEHEINLSVSTRFVRECECGFGFVVSTYVWKGG